MVKNLFISAVFCFSFLLLPTAKGYSQNSGHPLINVKTNPFASMLSMIPLTLETFVTEDVSFSASGFIVNSKNGVSESYFEQNGFGLSPELRFYFTDNEINGHKNRVFAGAAFNYEEYSNATLDRYDQPIAGWSHALGGALLIGNQWFFKNRFTFDVFLGPAYMSYVKSEEYDNNLSKGGFFLSMMGSKPSGTRIRFGFNIGIAF